MSAFPSISSATDKLGLDVVILFFCACLYIEKLLIIFLFWLIGGCQCDTNLFPDVDSSWKVRQLPLLLVVDAFVMLLSETFLIKLNGLALNHKIYHYQ